LVPVRIVSVPSGGETKVAFLLTRGGLQVRLHTRSYCGPFRTKTLNSVDSDAGAVSGGDSPQRVTWAAKRLPPYPTRELRVARARACARACVRARVCARVCVRACV
jgi:hypothetical protein